MGRKEAEGRNGMRMKKPSGAENERMPDLELRQRKRGLREEEEDEVLEEQMGDAHRLGWQFNRLSPVSGQYWG